MPLNSSPEPAANGIEPRGRANQDEEPHEHQALFEQDSEQDSTHSKPEDKATHADSKPVPPDFRRRPNLFGIWWLEILSCVLSIAALLGLFGTLYAYKDRPSPNWPRWMSLNTIVAIFVVVLKTGVVLILGEGIGQLKWSWFTKATRQLEHIQIWDNATRGPVGACVLLGRVGAQDLLASFGALLIILALAVDPFAQQIVHYIDCAIMVPGTAVLPRSGSFHNSGLVTFHAGFGYTSIEPGVQRAINAGIYNPSPSPDFGCSTDQLVVTNTSHLYNTTAYRGWTSNTRVPGGVSANVSSGDIDFMWQYAAMGPATAPVSGPGWASGSVDFIISAKPDCDDCDPYILSHWPWGGPSGTRCSFTPCVKTFNASVESGRLTEQLIDTGLSWGSSADEARYRAMLDVKCLNPNELKSLEHLGYRIEQNQRYLAYNLTKEDSGTNIDDTFPTSMQLRNCLYLATYTWTVSIQDYFQTLLNGTVRGYIPTGSTPPGEYTGPQVVQTFFDYGNATFNSVQGMFATISTSLTNYMRNHGEQNYSTQVQGIVHHSKVCIEVRSGWLAYPTSLVVLTVIFFVLLVVETWPIASRPNIWKSSPLALLFHGLAEESSGSLNGHKWEHLEEVRGMEAVAKSTAVRLEMMDHGLTQLVRK